MPLDVFCECGEAYLETNDKDGWNPDAIGVKSHLVRAYDPNRTTTAAMVRLKDKYVGQRDDIPHDNDLTHSNVCCPDCYRDLTDGEGRLKNTREQEPERAAPEFLCAWCKRSDFKTAQGFQSHIDKWCPEKFKRAKA